MEKIIINSTTDYKLVSKSPVSSEESVVVPKTVTRPQAPILISVSFSANIFAMTVHYRHCIVVGFSPR